MISREEGLPENSYATLAIIYFVNSGFQPSSNDI
jgi:hypothetical protein